jgi:hypothetical protein
LSFPSLSFSFVRARVIFSLLWYRWFGFRYASEQVDMYYNLGVGLRFGLDWIFCRAHSVIVFVFLCVYLLAGAVT